jgi:outer membrane lipoprotein SlyB
MDPSAITNAKICINYLNTMNRLTFWGLTLCLSLVSCTSGPRARAGTAIGALGGAAAGGLMGRSLGGAAVGAGIGALGGNIIGGAQDERNQSGGSRR